MESIITIKDKDLIECAKLYVEVFNAEPWNDNWTKETAFKRLNDIFISANFEGIVYIEDGEIKGAIFGNHEQYFDGMHYYLKEMFVSNELQGKGIGSKMLKIFEERLLESGVSTIVLFTSKGNKTSKFYLKNGFDEWTSMAMMGKEMRGI